MYTLCTPHCTPQVARSQEEEEGEEDEEQGFCAVIEGSSGECPEAESEDKRFRAGGCVGLCIIRSADGKRVLKVTEEMVVVESLFEFQDLARLSVSCIRGEGPACARAHVLARRQSDAAGQTQKGSWADRTCSLAFMDHEPLARTPDLAFESLNPERGTVRVGVVTRVPLVVQRAQGDACKCKRTCLTQLLGS